MKENRVKQKKPTKLVVIISALVILTTAAIGVTAAYSKLKEIWIRQCVITDVTAQAKVTEGKMVKADTILNAFGIKSGANLALIDFDAMRTEILKKHPCIRKISVTRHLPNRVEIYVEERRPIVRMEVSGRKASSGRVADCEGMVFTCRRGTGMLPTIRERETGTTPYGQFLAERSLAALRLVEMASSEEFASLKILDVDTAKPDFILATLGDYTQVKIAWEGMDNPTASNQSSLALRLRHLMKAIQSNVGTNVKVWNATVSDRIYADTKEIIQ